jgi:hypothetical protein
VKQSTDDVDSRHPSYETACNEMSIVPRASSGAATNTQHRYEHVVCTFTVP